MKERILIAVGVLLLVGIGIGGFVLGSSHASRGQDKVISLRDSAVVDAARWKVRFEEAELQLQAQQKITLELIESMDKLKLNLAGGRKALNDAVQRSDTAYVKNIILWRNARIHPAPPSK